MPNGRTDIFEIEKEDFFVAIQALSKKEEIGTTFGQPNEPVLLLELEEKVLKHKEAHIEIEEQYEQYYIIRVGNDIHKWVCVTEESRLFTEIRQLHLNKKSS